MTARARLPANFVRIPVLIRQLQKIINLQRHLATDTTDENIFTCPYKSSVTTVTSNTIPEVLFSNLSKWEKDPAFECGVSGRKYTYLEVYKFSRNFATALIESGLRKNEAVAVCLPNLPEFPIVTNGIWTAGLVMTAANPACTKDEFRHQMEASQAKCVITIAKCLPTVTAVKNIPGSSIKSIIVIDKDSVEGTHSFFQMIKTTPNDRHFLTSKGSFDSRNQVATILFSSGTTGLPKGVLLSHSNLATNVLQFSSPPDVSPLITLVNNEQGRNIGVLPFFHVYGLTALVNTTINLGFHCMTLPSFDKDAYLNLFRKHKPCYIQVVPALISFMVNSPTFTKEYLRPVEVMVVGSAPAGASLIKKFLKKSEKYIFIQEGYGMTESSPVTMLMPIIARNQKIGSIGKPLPLTMAKIVDPQTGKVLGRKENGELLIKGPQVMMGYLNNPKATAETLDADGWLHTGDTGYFDEDGYCYLLGRTKELIKVKGFQVSPLELENVLRTFKGIMDCAVLGVPTKKGEAPRAYIVRNDDQITEDAINKFMKEKLSDYKQLTGGIVFLKEIPKSTTGKYMKKQLLKEYIDKYGSNK